MSDTCPFGWKRAHKFEPRYDEQPGSYSMKGLYYNDVAELRDLMVLRTYVRDVCVNCGKTIERSKP